MTKILLIEDDDIVGEMLCMYLSEEAFDVKRAIDGQEGLSDIHQFNPDLILLDLVLPDAEGMVLCSQIRLLTQAPIIITSSKNSVSDRIQALTLGADDYMCKPFSMQELKARIYAILRRVPQGSALYSEPIPTPETLEPSSDIRLDYDQRRLVVRGESVDVTFSEFEIMRLLYQSPGRVYSRDEIINAVRGFDSYVNYRAIDVHITNLRKKIETNPKDPQHIKTVWGFGYKYIVPST
ncbi:response regulator transcription factor [Paenibacillus thalictri]|uniref:Response regulator transcription factor n=1 Tax=Paenibacillus thalictri TaxID=2527873 RepID=A0A4Q9DK21_9BACL|nr:response regulator transcription factor [Paenibacillus thalictri]TBL75074.1 response regulator transcription factor [Paenibacillus thalictri]